MKLTSAPSHPYMCDSNHLYVCKWFGFLKLYIVTPFCSIPNHNVGGKKTQ